MAILTIPDKQVTLADAGEIRTFLAGRGIWFDQWTADRPLANTASQEEILESYAHALKPFMAKGGYRTADVINVHADTPNLDELRARFLREHTHSEDEIRFFVDGRGYFWFHLDQAASSGEKSGNTLEEVFRVTCEAGDLLSVPAGVKHWFEMDEVPFVKTIRVFIDAAGWVPHYTDSGIDAHYRKTPAA